MTIADYTSPIPPAQLAAAGVVGVCRYLSWPYYWGGVTHADLNPKIIQRAEFQELLAAGVSVTLNWEFDAQDWLSGAEGGAAHADEAVRQARALGYPAGCTIIGSADFDMTYSQWQSAAGPYAGAFRLGLLAGGYLPGVYGPYDVLTWVQAAGGYACYWQAALSTAWSGGRNRMPWPGAHLRQTSQTVIAGQQVDISVIDRPQWGQAGGDTMRTKLIRDPASGAVWLTNSLQRWYIPDPKTLNNVVAVGTQHFPGTLLNTTPEDVDDPAAFGPVAGTLTLTADQITQICTAMAAAVVDDHHALSEVDVPLITAAAAAALREVLGSLDGATPPATPPAAG